MTSKATPTECYVFVTLWGRTEPVTAGRFEVTPGRRGDPVGRFVYGKSYLARPDAVALDPIELPLIEQRFETTNLQGLFGALRDSSPDHWGRRVIERHAGKAPLSELDYLLLSPDDRAGALSFGLAATPPAPVRTFNRTVDLERLQAIADALVADRGAVADSPATQVEELLLIGTSMGGARPKAVVEDADGLWMAKFNRLDDKWSQARVEHAMLMLARQCGITTAESRVVPVAGRDVLLVKRFDRERADGAYLRARMISALTLLRADESAQGRERWSYLSLVEELRRVSAAPQSDAHELFRRMCFNALISNLDDHPRNHALTAPGREWRLSPAYDLVPSSSVSLEHRDLALTVGDAGRYANAENLLSQAARFLLAPAAATAIVGEMEERIRSTWFNTARSAGVTERDCGSIQGAFGYPGFRLPLPGR